MGIFGKARDKAKALKEKYDDFQERRLEASERRTEKLERRARVQERQSKARQRVISARFKEQSARERLNKARAKNSGFGSGDAFGGKVASAAGGFSFDDAMGFSSAKPMKTVKRRKRSKGKSIVIKVG